MRRAGVLQALRVRGHDGALAAALLSGLLGAACGWPDETGSPFASTQPRPGVQSVVALRSALAFVDPAQGEVYITDAPQGRPRARRVPLCANPVRAVADSGADRLLVLCVGRLGGGGRSPEPASLVLVPASEGMPVQRVALPARFPELAQSPDGRFVVLYFGPQGASSLAADSIFNPNQLAVADLSGAGPALSTRAIRSMADRPRQVLFSPPLALPEGQRSLVVIGSRNYVTLFDPLQPMRAEITVPLTLADDRRTLEVAQALFDPGAAADPVAMRAALDPMVYLRVTGSSDIFALRLTEVPAAERTPSRNDFLPSLSQLAAARQPSAMALYPVLDEAGQRASVHDRLLVTGADNELVLIDADSSRSQSIPLEHRAAHVLVWEGPSPDEVRTRPRALLLGAPNGGDRATFVDLHRIETLRTRNLTTVRLPGVEAYLSRVGQGVVLVQHGGGALSVIRLHERSALPLSSSFGIETLRGFASQPERLWVVGGQRLAYLGIQSLGAGDVLLDAPAIEIALAPGVGTAPAMLLVAHAGAEGYVTALPADQPAREAARSLRGFVLQDLDDRPALTGANGGAR